MAQLALDGYKRLMSAEFSEMKKKTTHKQASKKQPFIAFPRNMQRFFEASSGSLFWDEEKKLCGFCCCCCSQQLDKATWIYWKWQRHMKLWAAFYEISDFYLRWTVLFLTSLFFLTSSCLTMVSMGINAKEWIVSGQQVNWALSYKLHI